MNFYFYYAILSLFRFVVCDGGLGRAARYLGV